MDNVQDVWAWKHTASGACIQLALLIVGLGKRIQLLFLIVVEVGYGSSIFLLVASSSYGNFATPLFLP